MSCHLSLMLRLLCFCFVSSILLLSKAEAFRSIVLRYACAPAAARSYLTTACFLFSLYIFCFFGDASFFEYSVSSSFPLCLESCTFSLLRMVHFYLCGHGLDFDIISPCENSINHLFNEKKRIDKSRTYFYTHYSVVVAGRNENLWWPGHEIDP